MCPLYFFYLYRHIWFKLGDIPDQAHVHHIKSYLQSLYKKYVIITMFSFSRSNNKIIILVKRLTSFGLNYMYMNPTENISIIKNVLIFNIVQAIQSYFTMLMLRCYMFKTVKY